MNIKKIVVLSIVVQYFHANHAMDDSKKSTVETRSIQKKRLYSEREGMHSEGSADEALDNDSKATIHRIVEDSSESERESEQISSIDSNRIIIDEPYVSEEDYVSEVDDDGIPHNLHNREAGNIIHRIVEDSSESEMESEQISSIDSNRIIINEPYLSEEDYVSEVDDDGIPHNLHNREAGNTIAEILEIPLVQNNEGAINRTINHMITNIKNKVDGEIDPLVRRIFKFIVRTSFGDIDAEDLFAELSVLNEEKYKNLSKINFYLLKRALYGKFQCFISTDEHGFKDINPWLIQDYGPIPKKILKSALKKVVRERNKKPSGSTPFEVPILKLARSAFLPESEIDFEEGELELIENLILNLPVEVYYDDEVQDEDEVTGMNYLPSSVIDSVPSDVLDMLWLRLTFNEYRKDLHNNPIAQKNAEKATDLSKRMLQNFLKEDGKAPSKKLLSSIIEIYNNIDKGDFISSEGKNIDLMSRYKNHQKHKLGSKILEIPREILLKIDKYLIPHYLNQDIVNEINHKINNKGAELTKIHNSSLQDLSVDNNLRKEINLNPFEESKYDHNGLELKPQPIQKLVDSLENSPNYTFIKEKRVENFDSSDSDKPTYKKQNRKIDDKNGNRK